MLWIFLLFRLTIAHIRLTHPPARFPSLDFIDNDKTEPPCGVPKNPYGPITWLRSGEKVNITWFQPVPHHGKLKLELLDDLEQLVTVLTPIPGEPENPALKSSVTVMLPANFECYNCVIRVIRQAVEIRKDYHFYSCADVNIVNDIPDGDTCLSKGTRIRGECECKAPAFGTNCQYEDECIEDANCGEHGKCILLPAEASPRKQCFCEKGFFGKECKNVSQSFTDDSQFMPSLYQMQEVGEDKDQIYWRILEDEIEFVLKFKTNSWVGVGWKQRNSDNYCPTLGEYASQELSNNLVTTTSLSRSSTSKRQNETVSFEVLPSVSVDDIQSSSSLVNHPTSGKLCKENEEFSDCPEFNRQCEASCDWTRFPETIPNCPRICGAPKCICKEGFVRAANDNETCVPFSYCSDEEEMECPTNSTWAKCGVACEPTCENMYDTSPCPATCDEPACTCADNYVRHKNSCIFWGDCPNLDKRFASDLSSSELSKTTANIASTRSVSVQMGAFMTGTINHTGSINSELRKTKTMFDKPTCGINETINECGQACEANCRNAYSRDKCTECHLPACACVQGYARIDDRCVKWSDCPREFPHRSQIRHQSTVPFSLQPLLATTIANNAINYSGTTTVNLQLSQTKNAGGEAHEMNLTNNRMVQSGVGNPINESRNTPNLMIPSSLESADSVSEVIGDVCYGDWRWPPGCRDCDYRISWNYLDDSDEIEFSIETRAPSNWWTGVGFSPTGTMVEADMIIVKSQNGELSLHDMYSTAYGVPREDSKQDVYAPTVIGTHVNGVLRAQFTRKRDTGDRKADHHFTETNCYKFLFPVSGGRLGVNGELSKHITTPYVSENSICIQSCTASQPVQPENSCETEFRYPAGCEGTACNYVAKWEYNMVRKDVKFEISSKELGRWTGIGFSRDGQMANSDMYTGWVYEGRAYVTDRFAYGRQLPAIDPADRQDIYEISGTVDDDIQTITFHRKVLPADTITDFPFNKCYYFLFPIGGGRILARKSQDFQNAKTPIGYHDLYQPKVSKTKICICDQNGKSIALEDAAPSSRIRRQEKATEFSEAQNQSKDPFEVHVDPFGEAYKGVHLSLFKVRKRGDVEIHDESEMNFSMEQTNLKLEGRTMSAHVPLQVKQLASASEIPSMSAASPLNDHSQLEKNISSLGNPTIPEVESTTVALTPSLELMTTRKKPGKNREAEHLMNCADVVIGLVVDGVSQVRDHYSFSRATPRIDEFFGGRDSLTSATAYQQDGITTVVFRKPLEASDKADRTISRGLTTVIWAKGVEPSTYMARGGSIFKDDVARTAAFFPNDVPKYHGLNRRGHFITDLFDDGVESQQLEPKKPSRKDDCMGSFLYPPNCNHDQCTYTLHWLADDKKISFSLFAVIPTNHWTGIGFSSDGLMIKSDIIVISVLDEATTNVIDMYAPDYSRPKSDSEQGVFNIRTLYDEGRLYANFSRYLVSNDQNDISLDHCVYFLYPVSGGKLDIETKEIRRHIETPMSSEKKICLNSCSQSVVGKKVLQNDPLLNGSVLPEESINPQTVTYDVVLRILNREWNPLLTNRNTKEFHQMVTEISTGVNALLETKFPKTRVIEIKKFSKGSVLAHLTVLSEDPSPPTELELKKYLNENAVTHLKEALHMEALSVVIRKTEKKIPMKEDIIRSWIVLGIGVSLFLIATFFVCCIVSRSRKAQSTHYKNYNAQYPMNGYGIHGNFIGSQVEVKKGGFENATYQANHTRQFSQATTASQNGTPKGSPNNPEESPKGIGETTYQEWYTKVASKPGARQHEETSLPSSSVRYPISRQSVSGPAFIPYSQDTNTFYGEGRLVPAGYFRPY